MNNEDQYNYSEMFELARDRAVFCSLLALPFNEIVDQSFIEQMQTSKLISFFETTQQVFVDQNDIQTGISLILDFLQTIKGQNAATQTEDLGVDRTRLFRGVSQTYGPPPPYEAIWRGSRQEVEVLQDLTETYLKANLTPSKSIKDRIDYLGVEIDYLRELAELESQAWADHEDYQAIYLLKLQHQFFRDHLAIWVPQYIEKALPYAKTDFLKGFLIFLRGFIEDQKEEIASLLQELNQLE